MIGLFPQVSAQLSHEIRTRVKGEVSIGFSAPETIQIIVPQPVTENDLRMLEAGERIGNWRKTWTETAVNPRDRISFDGRIYRVHQCDERSFDGGFYRVMMREVTGDVA